VGGPANAFNLTINRSPAAAHREVTPDVISGVPLFGNVQAMTNPPTGTVTPLFTDIEGSTRLWEAHAGAMRKALARPTRPSSAYGWHGLRGHHAAAEPRTCRQSPLSDNHRTHGHSATGAIAVAVIV